MLVLFMVCVIWFGDTLVLVRCVVFCLIGGYSRYVYFRVVVIYCNCVVICLCKF